MNEDPRLSAKNKENGMIVRLKQEWQGHTAGTILTVSDNYANTMFQGDTAEKMEAESHMKMKDKLQLMVSNRRLKTFNKFITP